jgi:acyl-CoA synthetase (AMP-forming)/AMP-acid ligase II
MTAATIPAVLDQAAERFGDAEALVDGDVRLSFADLTVRVDEVARAFVASGLEAGDRVGIWASNSAEWAIAALAAYRAGGVLVTLNTRFKGTEARDLIERSGCRFLFTETGFLDTDHLTELGPAPDCVQEIVVLRGKSPATATSFDRFVARAPEADVRAAELRSDALGPDDVSDILFTSGTTGRPKGAMLRHGASVRVFTTWAEVVGLRDSDRYLIVNPFFHTFGLKAGILACLLTGATMYPHAVFDIPDVIRRIADERITMLPGPPAIYQSLLDHPEAAEHDLSSLRLAVTGAANVPVEMIRRMYDDLGFETVVTGYGLTESTGVVTMCRHDDDPETIATTCGRPIPGIEVRLIDDTGAVVPPGGPGEILVRGSDLMAGYFEDPDATAEAIDGEGWLHTGDIGVLDERGYLRITDRKKDMFIVGGFNAYPAEIENLMMSHPSIAQVAVIGVPDQRLGEVGRAFVVARPGHAPDPEDLMAWCREHMANYKVPRSVVFLDALPLNAANKVLKDDLRALH